MLDISNINTLKSEIIHKFMFCVLSQNISSKRRYNEKQKLIAIYALTFKIRLNIYYRCQRNILKRMYIVKFLIRSSLIV